MEGLIRLSSLTPEREGRLKISLKELECGTEVKPALNAQILTSGWNLISFGYLSNVEFYSD
jgi:hypothetical protein